MRVSGSGKYMALATLRWPVTITTEQDPPEHLQPLLSLRRVSVALAAQEQR